MPDNETLLSHIARHHTIGREDVATDALAFILTHSAPTRAAFAQFLNPGVPDMPAIAEVRTRHELPHGAAPDLECLGDDDQRLAFVESKFWAGLTANQPVTYWNALPTDTPATLLFLAPAYRIDPGGLWDELAARLTKAGHSLADPVHQSDYTIAAPAKNDRRRLMVTSWKTLLDHLRQSALAHSDWQALFEIAQLQGLATSVITGTDPSSDDNLKDLVTRAVKRMRDTGWANTDGLSVGRGYTYWGRFMYLADALAWFGIDFHQARSSSQPLWLAFFAELGSVTPEQVRCRLAGLDLGETVDGRFRSRSFCIPLPLQPGADDDTALNAIVAQLTQIAELIDPNGPTYRKDAPNA